MKELEKKQKIKYEALCNGYIAVGLKNVNIPNKIIVLQCTWIKRLYNNYFHEWKLILLYLNEKSFGTSIKFHYKFHINLSLKLIKPRFSIDNFF